MVRGREEVGQGGLCEKMEGRDRCPPGKEEKSRKTGTGEVEEDPRGAVEPLHLLEVDLQSGPLVVAAPKTAER